MSNFSLKDSIDVSPQRTTEYLDAVRDAKKGKKGAIERLEKCVDDGMITATAYEDLCNKYKNARLIKRIIPSIILCVAVLVVCAIYIINAFAHSGRTDSSGGHNDNSNKSGLGSYHYHCGGYPPHLHTNGTCPYKSSSSSSTTSTSSASYATTATATQSDRYDEGYDDGYDEGHNDGYDSGYEEGYDEGYDEGYEDGYEEGQEKGYEEGYDAGTKEANEERQKEFYSLLILGGVIILIVFLSKLVKRHRESKTK